MSSNTYQDLIVGKGESIVNGDIHWNDFVNVYIDDHKDAFTLAMNILRQLESQQHSDKRNPVKFTLTGTLESPE